MYAARIRKVLLCACAALAIPLAAVAATRTATFNVTATVQSDCTITATNLAFGTVGIVTSNTDASSTISVTCTPGTAYSIGLDAGSVGDSTIEDRQMGNGTQRLAFQIYRDAGRLQVWGDTPPTDTVGGTGTGRSEDVTVYGRIPVQDTPQTGNYLSTITATITY